MTKGGKQTVNTILKSGTNKKKEVQPTKDIKFLPGCWLVGYIHPGQDQPTRPKNKFKLKEITSFVKISVQLLVARSSVVVYQQPKLKQQQKATMNQFRASQFTRYTTTVRFSSERIFWGGLVWLWSFAMMCIFTAVTTFSCSVANFLRIFSLNC